MIAYFLGNTCAIHCENAKMLSRVTAKNVGDVFLRHGVVSNCEPECNAWRSCSLLQTLKNTFSDRA